MDKPTYENLDKALQEFKIPRSSDEVREIIAGVAAAPDIDGAMGPVDQWLKLVSEDVPPELAIILQTELAKTENIESDQSSSANHLKNLRYELSRQNITGFIVPLADEHQGEYVPKNAQRLAWLTGFTGSAGLAIVLKNQAAIFVDGRYTLQARDQVDGNHFEINHLIDTPASTWLSASLKSDDILGFDPWLHTADGVLRLKRTCEKAGAKLKSLESNPIDAVWSDQPPVPLTPVIQLKNTYTGRTSAEKRQEIGSSLKAADVEACVLTAPDSIAWIANLRGGDVPYTPFSLCFGIQNSDGRLEIYSDLRKYPPSVIDGLDKDITIYPRKEFIPALKKLGANKARIAVDLTSAAHIISSTLENSGATVVRLTDPCQLPKAIKNPVELDGMRNAHLRDGVALVRFLAWLDENALTTSLSELSIADQLEKFRREGEKIQGLSFPTISGSGPNGAIVHYRVTAKSDRALDKNSLYLVDSGAQYLDGTTDVTRTIAIGTPSDEMKDRFTRVLKGHIALARSVFPGGTSGSQLDALARSALWEIGLDYDHGTGHGVGSFLSVHEGPHRISKLPNRVALEPGMVVSNEPGYYKTDEYGIRIENLVAVIEKKPTDVTGRPFLCFETLTLAPIDKTVIDKNLLTQIEVDWLNAYHDKVRNTLAHLLDKKTSNWLNEVTTPIIL